MPAPLAPLGPIALAALKTIINAKTVRTTGGIVGKSSKLVNPVYKNMTDKIQANSVKVIQRNKTPSIAESQAKIRKDLNMPKRGTPAYDTYMKKLAKNNDISSKKAGKASTIISKKTPKK